MKAIIRTISEEQPEVAQLLVHRETKAIRGLAQYIEREHFRHLLLTCYRGEHICQVNCRDIYYVETVQETQNVHTADDTYHSKLRLYELERLLPAEFSRVSKSCIINLSNVAEYRPMTGGIMQAVFANGESAYISRKYLKEIRCKIKEGLL